MVYVRYLSSLLPRTLAVEAARRAYDGLKYVLDKAGLLALKGLLEAAKAAMSIAEKGVRVCVFVCPHARVSMCVCARAAVAGLGDVAENFAENFDPNFDPRVILLKTKKIGMIAVAKGFELARKGAASFLEGLSDFGNTAQGALLYAKKKICQVGLDLLIAGSKAYSWTLDQAAKVVKGLVLDIFQLDTVRFQAQLSKSQVGVVEYVLILILILILTLTLTGRCRRVLRVWQALPKAFCRGISL